LGECDGTAISEGEPAPGLEESPRRLRLMYSNSFLPFSRCVISDFVPNDWPEPREADAIVGAATAPRWPLMALSIRASGRRFKPGEQRRGPAHDLARLAGKARNCRHVVRDPGLLAAPWALLGSGRCPRMVVDSPVPAAELKGSTNEPRRLVVLPWTVQARHPPAPCRSRPWCRFLGRGGRAGTPQERSVPIGVHRTWVWPLTFRRSISRRS